MFSTIGIIIDVVIIATLVIFGIIGFKKGFLHSIISLFSWVVCLAIAILTAKYVAGWINGIYNFAGLIGSKIGDGLIKTNEFFNQAINVYEASGKEALIAAIPAETNGLLKELIKIVFNNSAVDFTSTETIGSVIGYNLGHICMVIISGILVFVVLKIVVAILTKLFDKIAKTKILGGLNKILGLILGVVKGAVIVFIINVVLVGLSLMPAVNKTITPIIQDHTYVEKFVYNQTDKLAGKYIIEGEAIQNWINNLWNNR